MATFVAMLIGTAVGIRKLLAPIPISSQHVTQAELGEIRLSLAQCVTKAEFGKLETAVSLCVTKGELVELKNTMKDFERNINDTRHSLANSQQTLANQISRLLGAMEAGVGLRLGQADDRPTT